MKKFLIFLLVSISFFSLYGCDRKESRLNETTNTVLREILEENNYIVVDVRTKEEFDEGHVVGAINIPYDEIDSDCELDINKTIMVYCKSGRRSSIAYDTFQKMGYNVYDLGAYDSIDMEKE